MNSDTNYMTTDENINLFEVNAVEDKAPERFGVHSADGPTRVSARPQRTQTGSRENHH